MYLTRQRTFWQAQQRHSVLKWQMGVHSKRLAAYPWAHHMAEMTMPDVARIGRRADLIKLLQPVHFGSEKQLPLQYTPFLLQPGGDL
jgi:hypothetical protein